MFQKIKKLNKAKQAGFTIIETLVAVSILVIAVTGPLALAAKGLSYASYAKDEITAFYLVNEAIDVVRNIRDTNVRRGDDWLKIPGSSPTVPDTLINRCKGNGCYFDVWSRPVDLSSVFKESNTEGEMMSCRTVPDGLVRFGYDFSWPDIGSTDCAAMVPNPNKSLKNQTVFSRNIKIVGVQNNPLSGKPVEVRVTATVSWTASNGIQRSIVIDENLFEISF